MLFQHHAAKISIGAKFTVLVSTRYNIEQHAFVATHPFGIANQRIKMRRCMSGMKPATTLVITIQSLAFDKCAYPRQGVMACIANGHRAR